MKQEQGHLPGRVCNQNPWDPLGLSPLHLLWSNSLAKWLSAPQLSLRGSGNLEWACALVSLTNSKIPRCGGRQSSKQELRFAAEINVITPT